MGTVKKRIIQILVILLCALALCTFLSRTISDMLLPVVETGAPQSAKLSETMRFAGRISLPGREIYGVDFPSTITEVLVEVGNAVQRGDPLFAFRSVELELIIAEKLLLVGEAEQQLETLLAAGADADSLALSNARMRLDIARLEHEKAALLMPEDGIVRARGFGYVRAAARVGDAVQPGDAVMELAGRGEAVELIFLLDPEEAARVGVGDTVSAQLEGRAGNETRSELVNAVVTQIEPEGAKMRVLAEGQSMLELQDGAGINVTLVRDIGIYDYVLPKNCVVRVDGKNYIYVVREVDGMFGPSMQSDMTEVTVLGQDAYSMAILPSGDQGAALENVVYSASKPLTNGGSVRLG